MRKANNGEVLAAILDGKLSRSEIKEHLDADPGDALGRLCRRGLIRRVCIGSYEPADIPHCTVCNRPCLPLTGISFGSTRKADLCSVKCANEYVRTRQEKMETN